MILMLEEVKPLHLPGGLTHDEAMKNLPFFARCAVARVRARFFRILHRRAPLTDEMRRKVSEACVRGEFLNEPLIAEIRLRRAEAAAAAVTEAGGKAARLKEIGFRLISRLTLLLRLRQGQPGWK